MASIGAKGVKPRSGYRTSDHPDRGGQGNKVADPPVVPASVHIELADTSGIST
jgi:hypothetical protein